MKVTLAFVVSLDGRVTGPKGEESRDWASPEDQKFFADLVQKTGTVIMGRNTYLLHKKYFTKSPHIRRIIMTRDATLAASRKPGIEFSSLSPTKLIKKLEKEGCREVLLAAGPLLSAAFLKSKLVTDFYLTVEPIIFGSGLPIFDGVVGRPKLTLVSSKKLNTGGTMLLKYKVHV